MKQCYAETFAKPGGLKTASSHQGGFTEEKGVVGHEIVLY